MLTPGARVGSYEVVGPLGAGGMGEIWRARDTRLGREVAIKVLPEAFATDASRLSRFEREAKLLAALNHPGIAEDLGSKNGTFCRGTRIGAPTPLSDGDALRVGKVPMTFRAVPPEVSTATGA